MKLVQLHCSTIITSPSQPSCIRLKVYVAVPALSFMLSKVDRDQLFKPAFRCQIVQLHASVNVILHFSLFVTLFHYRSTHRSSCDARSIKLTFPSTDNTGPWSSSCRDHPKFSFRPRKSTWGNYGLLLALPPNAREIIGSAPLKRSVRHRIHGITLRRG